MKRTKLHSLDESGAADGDVPVWDATADKWIPGTASVPVPVTTIGPDGPAILFAADGHIIYVEAP